MGGGIEITNISPYAEYNLYSDPESANLVLQIKNLKIVFVTLDATH